MTIDIGSVRAALGLAARAPSVHNSQPWHWRVDGDVVELRADPTRRLPVTDADGRDLLLSCGAALHHLVVALEGLGLPCTVGRAPDPARPELLARVTIGVTDRGPRGDTGADEMSAVRQRRTDRRRFTSWPVPEQYLAELVGRAAAYGTLLRPVPEGAARHALEIAVRTAALAHAADSGYDAELTAWTGRARLDDGVPAANVPTPDAGGHGLAPRRFASSTMAEPDGAADGATLLVLGTSSDDRLSRLRAGEALSAVLLRATTSGLATCPLTEPIEVPGARELVRDQVLDGTLSPQVVLRIGFAPTGEPVPQTPRRPLDDQVEGLPAGH